MQLHIVISCLLYVLLAVHCVDDMFLKPITLPIEDYQYVEIATGNRGKYNKYRIDYNLNETYIYYTPTYSDSYNSHSEIFYFDIYKIRLDVIYDVPDSDISTTISTVHHDGVIGLGVHSKLWKYWSKATISSIELKLGYYDPYISDIQSFPIIFSNGDTFTQCKVNGKKYTLTFDMSSEVSYLPRDLFYLDSFLVEFYEPYNCYDLCSYLGVQDDLFCKYKDGGIEVRRTDYTIETYSGTEYRMVEQNRDNPTQIVLGRSYTDKMALYIDNISNNRIYKTVYNRQMEYTSKNTNAYLGFILALVYIFWLLLINSELADVERNNILLAIIQIYGLIIVFLSFTYNIFGIHCTRFLNHYLHSNNTLPFYILLLIVLFLIALNFVLMYKLFKFTRNPFQSLEVTYNTHPIASRWTCIELIRRLSFESTLLLALWIIGIEFHSLYHGYLYLIIIGVILTITHLVIAVMLFVKNSYIGFVFVPFSLFFLVYCNIIPYFNLYYYYHPYYYELILLFVIFIVVFPSMVVVVQIQRGQFLYRIERYDTFCNIVKNK